MTTVKTQCPFCRDGDVSAEVRVDPGEEQVLYYPDGSGHPGDPPSIAEVLGIIDRSCECFQRVNVFFAGTALHEPVLEFFAAAEEQALLDDPDILDNVDWAEY